MLNFFWCSWGMWHQQSCSSLGLLYVRPLQHWLNSRIPRGAWHTGSHRETFSPMWEVGCVQWACSLGFVVWFMAALAYHFPCSFSHILTNVVAAKEIRLGQDTHGSVHQPTGCTLSSMSQLTHHPHVISIWNNMWHSGELICAAHRTAILHPGVVQQILQWFGEAQVDLLFLVNLPIVSCFLPDETWWSMYSLANSWHWGSV